MTGASLARPRAVLVLGICGALATVGPAAAQIATSGPPAAPARPLIMLIRYDEDWRPLADPALRTQPLDRLKYLPLPGDGWLTLGGEQRLRYEAYEGPRFGFGLPGGVTAPRHDTYLLSRTTLHADLHLSPAIRAFVQVGAYDSYGEEIPSAPLNDNKVDLAQAFVDATPTVGGATALIRVGRHEMGFGSQRLIGVREGPNTRLAFDGVRARVTVGGVRLDGFVARPVSARYGAFDDASASNSEFAGIYATFPVTAAPGLAIDAYLLNLTRPTAIFATFVGRERRRTVGTRVSGASGGWDWDLEAAYQFGSAAGREIGAWTVANDVGYRFGSVSWKPRVFLRADVASGDASSGGGRLGTFEAPFPKLPYLTEAGSLFAPQNLMDIHPGVTARPLRSLGVSAEYAAVWKHRRADAFYLPPGVPQPGTAGGPRFSAHIVQLGANWSATPQLTFGGAYVHAFAGRGLRAGGEGDPEVLLFNVAAKF